MEEVRDNITRNFSISRSYSSAATISTVQTKDYIRQKCEMHAKFWLRNLKKNKISLGRCGHREEINNKDILKKTEKNVDSNELALAFSVKE